MIIFNMLITFNFNMTIHIENIFVNNGIYVLLLYILERAHSTSYGIVNNYEIISMNDFTYGIFISL